MRVVVVQGSPRRGGNTEIVVEAVLEGLKQKADADGTVIRAADKTIAGCAEDFACQMAADEPGCSVRDDMDEVYDALLRADLIILATPVFCWGVSAQLKAVLDRLYACFKFGTSPPKCLLAGKGLALVVTAGGGPNDGANLVEAMYDALVQFGQAADRGRFLGSFMKDPAQTRADGDLLERARQFGASLV